MQNYIVLVVFKYIHGDVTTSEYFKYYYTKPITPVDMTCQILFLSKKISILYVSCTTAPTLCLF